MSDRVQLGSLVKLSTESAKDPAAVGLTRSVGLDHIDSDDLRLRRWSDIGNGADFTRVFRPGDVLFGKRRSYQRKVALADFDGVCSGDILVVRSADPRLDGLYLAYLLASPMFIGHAISSSAGSLSPRIRPRDLERFEFDLPPLEEQRRIVEVMRAVDRAIEVAEAIVAAANSAITALVPPKGPPRKLSQIVDVALGISLSKERRDGSMTMFPYLRAANVSNGIFSMEDIKSMGMTEEESAQAAVAPRDVLMAEGGDSDKVGLPAWVPEVIPPNLKMQNSILRLRTKNEQVVSQRFVYWICKWFGAAGGFERVATGTKVKHLSLQGLRQIELPIADPGAQATHVETADALSRVLEGGSTTVQRAQALRASLLQELIG